MRRFIVLVTVILLMAAMLVATAVPALAVAGPPALLENAGVGVAVDPAACESPAAISPIIGWRGGTCWVFHPNPTSLL